jgi:hypothetical protein
LESVSKRAVENEHRSPRNFRLFISVCGILGVSCLILYFAAPFALFPFPPSDATEAQLVANVSQYQTFYLLAAWLQGTGSFLSVIFALGIVYLAKAWIKFSGWITLLSSVVIVVLSLSEGSYFLDTVQAISNGHVQAALTSFDLSFVFIHTFFIAPSLLLALAFVLRSSNLLPHFFWIWALMIGIIFEILGFAGLFLSQTSIIAIFVLVLLEIWMLAASVSLGFRKNLE